MLTALLPASLLIVAVLGSIFAGIAAPTEAAAVGAMGSVLLAIAYRQFSFRILKEAVTQTIKITSMVMLIVLGGILFASVFIIQGGDDLVSQIVESAGLGAVGVVVVFLLVVFQQILCIEFCQAARNFSNERPGQAVFSDAKSRVRCQQLPLV